MNDMKVIIETAEFKVSQGRLLCSALHMKWGIGLTLVLGLLFLCGTLCGIFIDIRWLIIALMVLFVAAPGMMAILYLNYALSPRCLTEVYPHKVFFTEEGIEVDALVPAWPRDEEEEQNEQREPAIPKRIGFKASFTEVSRVRAGLKGLVLELRGTPPGIVHVPYDVLSDSRADSEWIIRRLM